MGSMNYVELGLNCYIEFINEKLSHLDIENCQWKIESIGHWKSSKKNSH